MTKHIIETYQIVQENTAKDPRRIESSIHDTVYFKRIRSNIYDTEYFKSINPLTLRRTLVAPFTKISILF